jgi:rare lipoprotein A
LKFSNWQLSVGAALALMSLSLAVSCTTQQESQPPAASVPAVAPAPAPVLPATPPPRPQTSTRHKTPSSVRASYQGDSTAGLPTASGEPYDPNDLTAASKTLPIGSKVQVINPTTGKAVTVRINDRGPLVRGRSLDLSKHAAEELGITEHGVARVKVKPVASTSAKSDSTNSQPDSSATANSPAASATTSTASGSAQQQ